MPEKIVTAKYEEAKEDIKQTNDKAEKDSIPADNKSE